MTLSYAFLIFFIEISFENFIAFALSQSNLTVQNVEIRNNVLVPGEKLFKAIKIKNDSNFFMLNLNEMKHSIENLDNVKNAVVKRKLPGKILINIEERIPVIRTLTGSKLIDKDGKEVKTLNTLSGYRHLPELTGFKLNPENGIPEKDMKRFSNVMNIMISFYKKFSAKENKIIKIASSIEWVDLYNEQNTCIRFPYKINNDVFKKFEAVLKDLKKKKLTPHYIDLQFNNVIVKL